VFEELLRSILSNINSVEELEKKLNDLSLESRTCKLWIDGLIKPIFLIMLFVRAEREG
jgi:hypothetical protein